ncbi:AAA family ATPase [Fusarium tjaetaba]|uniref:AAA family ATPase n=1 Tax=Fusarium tjaetaba TaxID=1567544 RepID=A0A8H5RTI8_9HYPO|nr:AAA family ATPase [Fusarium tjaetaba]KAF5638790.1 AAA family ATPase [Fusarium tjaetaba]
MDHLLRVQTPLLAVAILGASSPSLPETRTRKKPITTVDWRAELCRVMDRREDISNADLLDGLDAAFDELKESRSRLQARENFLHGPPRHQVLYRIRCEGSRLDDEDSDASEETTEEGYTTYEKPPWVVQYGPHKAHLRAGSHVPSLELYLERNKDIAFLVYVDLYHPIEAAALPMYTKESICIISPHLRNALHDLKLSALEGIPHPDFEDLSLHIPFPYLWWFNRRDQIANTVAESDAESQCYLSLLQNYMFDRLQSAWSKVDELTSKGLITIEYLDYIYTPGQILISEAVGNDLTQTQCYRVLNWMKKTYNRYDESLIYTIRAAWWLFDGTFKEIEDDLIITAPDLTNEFKIESLSYYPQRFARPNLVRSLLDRGKMFWECRERKYVSTSDFGGDGLQSSMDTRFMIDMETYKYMHPKASGKEIERHMAVIRTIDPQQIHHAELSARDDFLMCLPTTIVGFNMNKKEWVKLDVHTLREVKWNSQAFEYLVISQVTKELIKAVVINQLGNKANADLIHGKGNGLFMLLHGGPGTGKTLTAESVAEIAKRPLYRVTCGDIGTKAEDVEKYLEIVMYLGKTWGCVVLLDEADVFLEQRSLVNLERNALVSVFLSVLEYYDGILILTSNRVGIFDAAFRSRIQLSLRYKNLGQAERHQIWENFLKHLDQFQQDVRSRLTSQPQQVSLIGYGMDISDLRKHLGELSQADLNGREIRNALSIARQLALYRQEALQFHHLKDVMDEAKKFDDYLNEINDGFSADDICRDRRER